MADGWIKVWRKIINSDIWIEKPFSKGQAWIDLLLLATASDHVSKRKGVEKRYDEGTVHFSLCYLSERWGWSRNKVYRFIKKLQNDGMIVYQGRTGNGTMDGTVNGTTNGTALDTVLTVVNWALYQGKPVSDGTTNGTVDGTRKRTGNGTHPKNDIYPKNGYSKEGKKKRSLRSDSPFGGYERGTDEFRNRSHLLLKQEEGTVDDIPTVYRDGTYQEFDNFADYWRWRNQ